MSLARALEGLGERAADRLDRPRIYDLARADDAAALDGALARGEILAAHDTFDAQLRELLSARDPAAKLGPAELASRVTAHLRGRPALEAGRWVHYPWSGRLVHTLPPDEFLELRCDRNRLKITREEQLALRRARIGIVGLSVGKMTALTLALEGVGGELRLADFDTLSLSNLNRVRASLHHLGTSKVLSTAHDLYEIDPYLSLALFPRGVSEAELDAFLLGGGKLDLLIEECDDLYMKVRLRERARELGIPVVMDTSDRGLLDVERFDLEPGRPLLHGMIGDLRAESLRGLDREAKLAFVLRLLGESTISAGLAASLPEIDETLSTWPQLGSAVALGGAVATDVARRILLGTFRASGRFYVDVEGIVSDAPPRALTPPHEASLAVAVAPSVAPSGGPPAPLRVAGAPSADVIRALVGYAVLAPSGGNVQPWRFVARGALVDCHVDEARAGTFLDFGGLASCMAVGAAVENLVLAAGLAGLSADVTYEPEGAAGPLARVALGPGQGLPVDPLARAVPERATNRRLEPRAALDADTRAALAGALAPCEGARLALVEDGPRLRELGAILGAGERLRLLSERMHREMMSELRWSDEEARATRDGIDVGTLELSPALRAALGLTRQWPAMHRLAQVGGGRALERPARDAVDASSAIGVVAIRGEARADFARGGRALERVWLAAAARGAAFQPFGALTYLFTRLARGAGEGLSPREQATLGALHERYLRVFPLAAGESEILLFRVGRAAPPTARALRRPVDDVLRFE